MLGGCGTPVGSFSTTYNRVINPRPRPQTPPPLHASCPPPPLTVDRNQPCPLDHRALNQDKHIYLCQAQTCRLLTHPLFNMIALLKLDILGNMLIRFLAGVSCLATSLTSLQEVRVQLTTPFKTPTSHLYTLFLRGLNQQRYFLQLCELQRCW